MLQIVVYYNDKNNKEWCDLRHNSHILLPDLASF